MKFNKRHIYFIAYDFKNLCNLCTQYFLNICILVNICDVLFTEGRRAHIIVTICDQGCGGSEKLKSVVKSLTDSP